MRVTQMTAAAAMVATVLMSGCRVESSKQNGNDNVRIATPFGGMQVKTNDATVLEGMGLPAYPGATLIKKDNDHGAADVNMNFGSFHLRVKAASYQTSDSPDQVKAFYRKALAAYQDANDALAATQTLKHAFRTDVGPILAMARPLHGGAIDPVATYRKAGYRQKVAAIRPAVAGGSGGIV